jgi:hypothetical protein
MASVSMRALVRPINRELLKDGRKPGYGPEVLKKARMRDVTNLGDWWILCIEKNYVAGKFINPEELGRELGILKPWERVADDSTYRSQETAG